MKSLSPADVQKTKVVLVTMLAAIGYGIVHDQITARLCVEYFTVAHPPLFHTSSPTILGFCWGIFATIGIGAVLGTLLAAVSQSEESAGYPISSLVRAIFILLGAMAYAAALAGFVGFELSRKSIIAIPQSFRDMIPAGHWDWFMAVWFAHCASYFVGMVGGALLVLRIWKERGRPRILTIFPRTKLAVARALTLAAVVAGILYLRFSRS